jgi:hypothetical protein
VELVNPSPQEEPKPPTTEETTTAERKEVQRRKQHDEEGYPLLTVGGCGRRRLLRLTAGVGVGGVFSGRPLPGIAEEWAELFPLRGAVNSLPARGAMGSRTLPQWRAPPSRPSPPDGGGLPISLPNLSSPSFDHQPARITPPTSRHCCRHFSVRREAGEGHVVVADGHGRTTLTSSRRKDVTEVKKTKVRGLNCPSHEFKGEFDLLPKVRGRIRLFYLF